VHRTTHCGADVRERTGQRRCFPQSMCRYGSCCQRRVAGTAGNRSYCRQCPATLIDMKVVASSDSLYSTTTDAGCLISRQCNGHRRPFLCAVMPHDLRAVSGERHLKTYLFNTAFSTDSVTHRLLSTRSSRSMLGL